MKKPLDNQRGMTLLEILVAMAILAVLTFYIAQTIQSGTKSKAKIEKDIDRYSSLRDALKVIEGDVNKAFNYRDINIQLYNEAMKEREEQLKKAKAQPTGGNTATPTTPSVDNDEDGPAVEPFKERKYVNLTAFNGTENYMHFTSLNNVQTVAEVPQSDQMEVGYFVETCRGRVNKKQRSQCLWRRTNNFLDEDVKEGGEKTVLLENVESFQLRYLGPLQGDAIEWTSTWNSKGQDASQQGVFPLAVEVTLKVKDSGKKKDKVTGMTMVAQIRNPNNPTPEEKTEGQQGTPRGQ